MLNEGALVAVRRGADVITHADVYDGVDRILQVSGSRAGLRACRPAGLPIGASLGKAAPCCDWLLRDRMQRRVCEHVSSSMALMSIVCSWASMVGQQRAGPDGAGA